jgi:hypothetical protein
VNLKFSYLSYKICTSNYRIWGGRNTQRVYFCLVAVLMCSLTAKRHCMKNSQFVKTIRGVNYFLTEKSQNTKKQSQYFTSHSDIRTYKCCIIKERKQKDTYGIWDLQFTRSEVALFIPGIAFFFKTEHHVMKAYWRSGGIAPSILWPRH